MTDQNRSKPVSIQYLQAFFIFSPSKNIEKKQTFGEQIGEQIQVQNLCSLDSPQFIV